MIQYTLYLFIYACRCFSMLPDSIVDAMFPERNVVQVEQRPNIAIRRQRDPKDHRRSVRSFFTFSAKLKSSSRELPRYPPHPCYPSTPFDLMKTSTRGMIFEISTPTDSRSRSKFDAGFVIVIGSAHAPKGTLYRKGTEERLGRVFHARRILENPAR